jgi:POT family proton-dependent oligopeptide transporter
VASWFLASFAGSLAAGLVGSMWTYMSHPAFFVLLAAICAFSAVGLRLLDARARRVGEATKRQADPG